MALNLEAEYHAYTNKNCMRLKLKGERKKRAVCVVVLFACHKDDSV